MKRLLIDIETAPNIVHAWGLWRQNISIKQVVNSGYTLCWAAKWYGKRGVLFDSVHASKPEDMIRRAWDLLSEADAVIHYNGSSYDVPILNKEFIQHGYPPPDPYKEIDLLRVARSRFRFASNKLDYISQALGLGSKVQHKGHELWIGCMAGNESDWRAMERYNKRDVRLLELVYDRMLPWIRNHPNFALFSDDEKRRCTNCGSHKVVKVGIQHNRSRAYQRYRCKDCHTPLRDTKSLPRQAPMMVQA